MKAKNRKEKSKVNRKHEKKWMRESRKINEIRNYTNQKRKIEKKKELKKINTNK